MATNAFQPAAGGASRGESSLSGMSKQYAARDMPANKTLKYREKGQNTQDELKLKDREGMRRELEERERSTRDKQRPSSDVKRITSGGTTSSSRSKPAIAHTETNIDADDPLDESSSDEESTSRNQAKSKKPVPTHRLDDEEEEEEDEDDDDDNDDDEEDDTAELMAELARIKRERAAEAARIEEQKRVEEEKIRMENILRGNPLLNPSAKPAAPTTTSADFRVKRRWDDDVVFKNCAKADGSSGEKRVAQFINDSLRSEFHRRFMDKYIK